MQGQEGLDLVELVAVLNLDVELTIPVVRSLDDASAPLRRRPHQSRLPAAGLLKVHIRAVRQRVLTERGGIGRTPQFTAVRLNAPVEPGVMLDVGIAAHDGKQLIAA